MQSQALIMTEEQKQEDRQARLARIQKLQATEETNTSVSQNIANIGMSVGMIETAQEAMNVIPDAFYPDNPAKDTLFPGLAYSSWSFI